MPVIEQSAVISRPTTEVWGYLTNADHWPNWDNSMVECRQTTDGPLGVGTQWRGVTRILGKRIDWTSECSDG